MGLGKKSESDEFESKTHVLRWGLLSGKFSFELIFASFQLSSLMFSLPNRSVFAREIRAFGSLCCPSSC